jgi:filamentous hemagglutinin family protein
MHKTYLTITAALLTTNSVAQIALDGTLGPSGPLQGPNFAIEANHGRQVGTNLFHSFDTFNLNQNQSATFTGPNSITHVISRVTGGTASQIDGVLASKIPEADFYFINPAGVMFGENARLDVQGSFHASTADYLRLGNDGRFAATHPENSFLTIAPPSAFGFLDETPPAALSKTQSFLEVPEGKTLSFISGDITLEDHHWTEQENAGLSAPDGHIYLISVASSGEVPVDDPATLSDNAFKHFGTLKITDVPTTKNNERRKANVDTSGNAGGGNIYIRGGQIVMENAYVWADTKDANGQGLTIKATDDFLAKGARITTEVYGTGDGGDINVTAKQITLTDGAQIATNTSLFSDGAAGDIRLTATEAINISGFFFLLNDKERSGLSADTVGTGKGGQITVQTPALTLADDSSISTGTIGPGDAGDLLLQVDRLTLKQGAQISLNASNKSFDNTGHSGSLTITAKESVLITGQTERRSALTSNTFTTGDGGNIIISAPRLEIQDNGTLQAGTRGAGTGGQISLYVGQLYLNKGTITASSLGEGEAGNLRLNVGEWLQMQNSAIKTETDGADGGSIKLTSPGYLYLIDSAITTSVKAKQGDGGNLTLTPKFIVLDDSQIIAQAVSGDGGNINITTTGIYPTFWQQKNVIDASSEFGLNGIVTINAPDTDISGTLIGLPRRYLEAALANNRCTSLTREDLSRFTITTRDVIPPGPNDLKTHTLLHP